MWTFPQHEPQDIDSINRNNILLFGGYSKQCYNFNFETNSFFLTQQELTTKEKLSNILFKTKENILELQKEDVIDVQPIIVAEKMKLILLGNYNIHVVDLRSF